MLRPAATRCLSLAACSTSSRFSWFSRSAAKHSIPSSATKRQRDAELDDEERAFFGVLADRLASDLTVCAPLPGEYAAPALRTLRCFGAKRSKRVTPKLVEPRAEPIPAIEYTGMLRGLLGKFAQGPAGARLMLMEHEAIDTVTHLDENDDTSPEEKRPTTLKIIN